MTIAAPPALAGFECNEHGAVITADNGSIYCIGKSCDAAKKGGGTGKWWMAASGLAIEINGTVEAFIRFDVDCDLPPCWSD